MTSYQTKQTTLPGTNVSEVAGHARHLLHSIEKRTKRQPYVRSAYFNKQKVFLNYFWPHLQQKVPPERFRRLRYLAAALEVIRYSRHHPWTQQNPNKPREILHRFAGTTPDGKKFYVQVKENKRTNRLYLMSCFPAK